LSLVPAVMAAQPSRSDGHLAAALLSRAGQRWIAVAAHLALLLAMGAPTVSRWMLPDGRGANHRTVAAAGRGMAMPLSGGMPMPHGTATDPGGATGHPDGQDPGDACGYCFLFVHSPLVATVAATLATLPPLPAPAFPAARATLREQPAHLAFRPRGPPVTRCLSNFQMTRRT
jgi:hypothetical protein